MAEDELKRAGNALEHGNFEDMKISLIKCRDNSLEAIYNTTDSDRLAYFAELVIVVDFALLRFDENSKTFLPINKVSQVNYSWAM